MKKTLSIIIILVLALTFMFSQSQAVFAKTDSEVQVLDTYNPSLLPDSSFYFIKTWGEGIQEFFAFNTSTKAELNLKLANKRLIEAQKLDEEGKTDLAQKLLDKFQERMEKSIEKTNQAKDEGKDVSELVAKLTANSVRQQAVLARVYDKVPEQAKEAILNAMEKSNKGLTNAIQNVQGIHKKQDFENEVRDTIEKSGSKGREKMKEKLQNK